MSRLKQLTDRLSERVSVAAIASPIDPEGHRRIMWRVAKYLNALTRINTVINDEPER